MEYRLELVVVPVSDVDRAKAFYEGAGFAVDSEHAAGDFRVVQLSPPGSPCAIAIGTMRQAEPGSAKGLHLVVDDIFAAQADLTAKGVPVGEPFHFGAEGMTQGPDPERRSYNSFMQFDDPDGNVWLVQEVHRAGDPS
ncbi:MAG TPA: VOC family protein [Miltoncostaea sp.]|nr:VOC family protein [Miltoncostaea sp.]